LQVEYGYLNAFGQNAMPRKKKQDYRAYGWKYDEESSPGVPPLPTMSNAPIPDTSALTTTSVKLPAEFVEIEAPAPGTDGDFTIREKKKKPRRRKKRSRSRDDFEQTESDASRPLLNTVNNVAIFLGIFCLVASCGEMKMFIVGVALIILSWRIEEFLRGDAPDDSH
jgi:hypothetical protein